MKPIRTHHLLERSNRLYVLLLHAYPYEFRHEYGAEMAEVFRTWSNARYRDHGVWGLLQVWHRTLGDWAVSALEEHTKEQGMNTLSSRELILHVKVLGWLYLSGHALMLLLGGGAYFFAMVLQDSTGAPLWWRAMALLLLLLITLLALTGMLAGYGLLMRRRWARILALVVGFLGLQNFPVGTAVGVYALWVLLQRSAADLFMPGTSMQAKEGFQG